MPFLKSIFQTLVLIAAVWALALLLDQITPLTEFSVYLDAHPQPWVTLAWVLAGVGLVLLLGAWAQVLFLRGRPMSEDEARTFAGRSGSGGPAAGREGRAEISFHQVKVFFRTGAWLREPEARMWAAGLIGLWLLVFGLFGFFFVIGPPAVKVIVAAAVLYAFARFCWAVARA